MGAVLVSSCGEGAGSLLAAIWSAASDLSPLTAVVLLQSMMCWLLLEEMAASIK